MEKFRRSNYDEKLISVHNIYPKGWSVIVLGVEMLLVLLTIYNYKVRVDYVATMIGMAVFYIVAISEFTFRYILKSSYYKKGFCMGQNSRFYYSKIKILIIINIGAAVVCFLHVFINFITHIQNNYVYEEYWIWVALITFLICFEPFNDMTSGFSENYFLTDKYIVDFSQISDIRIVSKRASVIGNVCKIEVYKDGRKVGLDRVWEEDLFTLKKIINRA